MKKKEIKKFIVSKHVYATSAHEAIKKEASHEVYSVVVDESWRPPTEEKIGFHNN